MGPIANAICLSFIDKVGRKLPLAWTSVALVIDMTLIMVFSKYFPGGNNRIGQGFTIAWIFVFSFIFSLGWVYFAYFLYSQLTLIALDTTPYNSSTLQKYFPRPCGHALQPVRSRRIYFGYDIGINYSFAVCAFMGTGVGLLFNQLSPRAFANIGWRYYTIFLACDIVAAFCFFMFYP